MKILKLHFYLLMCCGAAEGFTEKSVDLGQNVTLNCEVAVKHVLWCLMKPSEPPVFILRSFSSRFLLPEYSNSTFSKSFSLQYNSSLFIHNISTNELGVYYCVQTDSPSNVSSGIRLYIQNHSAANQTCEFEKRPNHTAAKGEDVRLWQSLFVTLGVINCLVIMVVPTGFAVCRRKRYPNTPARPPDTDLQLRQSNTGPVLFIVIIEMKEKSDMFETPLTAKAKIPRYEEVQYNQTNQSVSILNGTYTLLHLPNP